MDDIPGTIHLLRFVWKVIVGSRILAPLQKCTSIGAPNRMVSDRLGTTSNPQTPWQVEHVFKITLGMVELHLVPVQSHGTSRQLEVIPSNSRVFKYVFQEPSRSGLECSSSGVELVHGGRVIGGVRHYMSCVYTARTVFFCTSSCLISLNLCTASALHSAIAVHCDYRVARHPLEDIATY